MSTVTTSIQCYDFLSHCDNECKRVIIPYLNGIQRILFEEHGRKPYYSIPFVIKSICCTYYCKHLHIRLSFKSFFNHHHESHCRHNWKSCASIQRIIRILTNYQHYLQQSHCNSRDALSPYVTYKYYQMKQILHDIAHINSKHPQNMVKFYIRNQVIQQNGCTQSGEDSRTCSKFEYNNDTEQWLKYNMFSIHQQFIHHSESKLEFERALRHIITRNQSQKVFSLLQILRSVARKLYKDGMKYRRLDALNPWVQERLIGFEGVLKYLSLLGFESNSMGNTLLCAHEPSAHVIATAISVIDAYHPGIHPQLQTVNVQQTNRCTNRNHGVEISKRVRIKSKQTHNVMNVYCRCTSNGCLTLKTSGTECIIIDDEIVILKMKTVGI